MLTRALPITALLLTTALLVAVPISAAERPASRIISFSAPSDAARLSVENARLSRGASVRIDPSGVAARVDFAVAEWPQLKIRPEGAAWDWAEMQALAIPVENPTGDTVEILVRLDDDPNASGIGDGLTGRTRLLPREAVVLVLPLRGTDAAKAMGMLAGPPPAQLDGSTRMIGGARGTIDRRHVTALHLTLPRPATAHSLVFGEPWTIREVDRGEESYQRIVDAFGQYTGASWPGKVGSSADIEDERQREERELQDWVSTLPPFDRYGGLLDGPPFAATGFFRVERRNGRWWLVTPDGHGFFSLGIDVVQPDGGRTYVEGREYMFADLPALTDPLAAHYGSANHHLNLPAQRGRRFDRGRTFDFYAANLERKYGRDYIGAWRHTAIERLRAWGFNTIGNWSEPALLARHEMAYVVPIHLHGNFARVSSGADWWDKMPDPFDPQFTVAADAQIGSAALSYRDDPFLIGYFVDNELPWGLGDAAEPWLRHGLGVGTLQLGAESPAKRAFMRLLMEKYGDVASFAVAWGISASSWDDLDRSGLTLSPEVFARPEVLTDLGTFTALYAETYFRTVAEAIRRHDAHHLYLGSRFQARTPEAVAACAKYCDVVSFNIYQRDIAGETWARFHALGKPAVIGEFHFGSTDRGLFWPGLYDVDAEQQRGPAYAAYLQSALANPDIVGCHWFQYADEPLTGRLLDGENGHVGFVSVADVPYASLVTAAREANLKLLRSIRASYRDRR